jgi:hypothetical protein
MGNLVWGFDYEIRETNKCIVKAKQLIDEGNCCDAIGELYRAEHFHLVRAQNQADPNCPHQTLILQIYRKDIQTLIRRLGWFWRILKNVL